jgi:hypothetical protein
MPRNVFKHIHCRTSERYTERPRRKVNILGGHSIGHSKQKRVHVRVSYPNGFRNRAISLYSTLYRRATRHVLTRAAKCIDVDRGIFEIVLY